MTEILITGGVGIVSSIISGWASWVFARKKYNSEVDGNLIENMQKSLDFYQKLSNDNKERLEQTLQDNVQLRKAVEELLKENKQLRKEIDTLKNQVIKITTTICTDLSCQIRSKDFSVLNIKTDEETEFEQSV